PGGLSTTTDRQAITRQPRERPRARARRDPGEVMAWRSATHSASGRYTFASCALKVSDISANPASIASVEVRPLSSAYARLSAVIRIEQNFGPHIEQKCAVFAGSAGSVSSWNDRAVSGSSERLNWSSQRNSNLAFDNASSQPCAPGCPLARSAAWAAIL